MDNDNRNECIVGTVEHITYKNTSNGYCVSNVQCEEENVVCVGIMPDVEAGETVKMYGEHRVNPTYGKQFCVMNYEILPPEGAAAILRYLSSGIIKGIGPTTARLIVEKFGDRSLEIIENDFERLVAIRGISLAKAKKISDALKKQSGIRETVMHLSKYSINSDEAIKIYKVLGKNSVTKIEENPYLLYDEEIGFAYERVCAIAENFNSDPAGYFRISAGICYILRHNLQNGHTCIPIAKLCDLAVNLLNCDRDVVSDAIVNMKREMKIKTAQIFDDEFVFLTKYFVAENYIATKFKIMLDLMPKEINFSYDTVNRLETLNGIHYENKQIEAINSAVKNAVFVLTGGPGTGKTTTLRAIKSVFEDAGLNLAFAAPTGRAAKRLSEVVDCDAKTIHRLLEVEWDESEKQVFARNEKNPLNYDAVIVDEMSMVDALLMEALLRALPLDCRIIMVGDSDQLPSVGAGNILGDILASQKIPVVVLTEIFRQALSSLIVTNAHNIVNGIYPVFGNKNDMFMIDIPNSTVAAEYIVDLYSSRLPKAYKFNPLYDIQVLCPSKKTSVGTGVLNNLLQARLNPPAKSKPEYVFKGYTLRKGDKVMQTKNNYDIEWIDDKGEQGTGVFNGDIGFIEDINIPSAKITVRFDGKIAFYSTEDADQLELSYAVTIHKSQGSEFSCVIIPVLDTPQKLRYRNLLYTAVTRARKILILVGSNDIVRNMTDNAKKTLRYNGLRGFLSE